MKAKTFKWLVPAVLLALVMTCGAYAQSSTSFSMKWSSLNSGGAQGLSSASFKLSGTLGQSVAGSASSTSFKAYIGFWVPQGALPVPVANCGAAKVLPDGSYIELTGKIATTDAGDFSGFFYMEESDRTSGMRVVASSITGDTLARGKTVAVTGTLATTSAGERQIIDATVVVSGVVAPRSPLGMINKSLGGGSVGNPASGLGQYGVSGGTGANNVGLLVRVWGQVTGSGTNYVTIDDGSGTAIRVDTSGAPSVPTTGYALVTGVSSLYGSAGSATRLVLAID